MIEINTKYHRNWYQTQKYKRNMLRYWAEDKYKGTPCMDCGGVFEWVSMDWDHRPGEIKLFGLASMGRRTINQERIKKMEDEMAKCDLVCANCHRVRTRDRNQY